MNKFDLTWGESVVVRQRFLEQTSGKSVHFGLDDLRNMDYTPFNGDQTLIDETAKVILRQTGQTYKHIFLTNGASGGCTIALRAYGILGADMGYTNPAPYFPLYPGMFNAANIRHGTSQKDYNTWGPGPFLLDTPSNPAGQHVGTPDWAWHCPVIWDAVYHNNVYCTLLVPAPKHDVVVGSYSKLTGLNGIRLGWIGTNDDRIAGVIAELIAPEYCGLSRPSKTVMLQLLDQYNADPEHHWGAFEHASRYWLDMNREQWAKLEKYFGGTPVAANGMFYYAQMDESAKKLFTNAGVLWQSGSKCGTDDSFARFNVGQDSKVIKEAVKSVLKADKI